MPALRSTLLALSWLALLDCRPRDRSAPDAQPSVPHADAHAEDRLSTPDAGPAPSRGPVVCSIDGPDRALAVMPLTRLRIAAHGTEAMLVAEYTSSFAPEPAGDSVDTHASRWWRFDLQNPSQSDTRRGREDPIGERQSSDDPAHADPNTEPPTYMRWGEDAERPVWADAQWTRWRHASCWGGPACSPCGTVRARIGAPDARNQRDEVTDVLQEFEVATIHGASIGAALVRRHDYTGPEDEEHNVCGESVAAIETLIPTTAGFTRREIKRWPAGEYTNAASRIALASGPRETVLAWLSGGSQREQQIELVRLDSAGRAIAAPRVVHSGRGIAFIALAFIADQLALVWNERPNANTPAVLRWTRFDPRQSAPPPAPSILLDASPRSIDEFSLGSDALTAALLWAEKPARGNGTTVHIAVATSFDQLSAHASQRGIELARTTQPGSVFATSVAVAGDRVWAAFNEPMRGYDTRPRARSLRCDEIPRDP
ncbi:MAG: hypothetical protein U0269_14630 [Polyangiales bacterium]